MTPEDFADLRRRRKLAEEAGMPKWQMFRTDDPFPSGPPDFHRYFVKPPEGDPTVGPN